MIDKLYEKVCSLPYGHGLPGIAIATLSQSGVRGFSVGKLRFGEAESVSLDTAFPIGCLIKTFIATLVVHEVDEGLLKLDVPISRYLPELSERCSNITLRHLLSQSSGIRDDILLNPGDIENYRASFCKILTQTPQIFKPGEHFSYCDTGYIACALIIERLHKKPWEEVLRHKILNPLCIPCPFDQARLAASEHTSDLNSGLLLPIAYEDPDVLDSAGSSRSKLSAVDLLQFAKLHLNEGCTDDGLRLLSRESVREMQKIYVDIPSDDDFSGFGLGWAVSRCGALYARGAGPGFTANLVLVPEKQTAIAVVANCEQRLFPLRMIMETVSEFLEVKCCADQPDIKAFLQDNDLTDNLEDYCGTYEGHMGQIDVAVDYRGLFARFNPHPRYGTEISTFRLIRRNEDFFVCLDNRLPFSALIFIRSEGAPRIDLVRTNWCLNQRVKISTRKLS